MIIIEHLFLIVDLEKYFYIISYTKCYF